MRKPCPPSMAERPAYCPESSRARLDMVRALADHVSAVYFMTADCYETAEEEPQELLPILNFLIDLGDMTCYARRGFLVSNALLCHCTSCYGPYFLYSSLCLCLTISLLLPIESLL